MTTFVFVHGAFFGGWCWDLLAERLRAHGDTVIAPTLAGLAERAHLNSDEIDLDRHINDVVAAIDQAPVGPLVLAGHSYGGMPAMGAADRRFGRIDAIFFLDAFVPLDGQSAVSIRDSGGGAKKHHVLPAVIGSSVPPLKAEVFGLDGPIAEHANARLTPLPYGAITQPIRLTGQWRQIPRKTYLRAQRFAAPYFDATSEALAQDAGWQVIERDCNHCPMLTEPDWLAAQLRSILS